MKTTDQKILEALEAEFPSGSDAPLDTGLTDDVLSTFRGRRKYLSVLVILVSILIFAIFVWAALGFARAETATEKLDWLALGGAAFVVTLIMKVWYWLEMQSNRLLREVKRVELLLVQRER